MSRTRRDNVHRPFRPGGPLLALLTLLAVALAACSGSGSATVPPAATKAPTTAPIVVGPPDATPLAHPPSAPAGDGTTATIHTAKGDIVIELYNESSPVAAENFANLAKAGWYDGKVFHRIAPGFVIQGGSPNGDGYGDAGYSIPDEPVVGHYLRGTVAMANTGNPNSQGSQFFIVLDDKVDAQLGRTYAIFGNVVQGMDVVDAIAAMPNSGSPDNKALQPVVMETVTVSAPGAAPSARPS
jgi:cyclophilin family peptidyl-prolyl cis-trans isomerase